MFIISRLRALFFVVAVIATTIVAAAAALASSPTARFDAFAASVKSHNLSLVLSNFDANNLTLIDTFHGCSVGNFSRLVHVWNEYLGATNAVELSRDPTLTFVGYQSNTMLAHIVEQGIWAKGRERPVGGPRGYVQEWFVFARINPKTSKFTSYGEFRFRGDKKQPNASVIETFAERAATDAMSNNSTRINELLAAFASPSTAVVLHSATAPSKQWTATQFVDWLNYSAKSGYSEFSLLVPTHVLASCNFAFVVGRYIQRAASSGANRFEHQAWAMRLTPQMKIAELEIFADKYSL